MRNGKPYLGGGRYIQASGAAGFAGREIRKRGNSKVFILGGKKALDIALERVEPSLAKEKITYQIEIFQGHCTLAKAAELKKKAEAFGADIIVGIGGGKALDTAKLLANDMDIDVVTIPTSAATCAAFAVLSVIYSDEGDVLYSTFHDREVAAVLVDLDLLSEKCPPRMLASGIADAAAKYPEIAFSMDFAVDWEKSVLPSASLALSKFTWDLFNKIGVQAVADTKANKISPEVEDSICAAIALTGTVSSLVSGGRQLAIAHTFYDGVCKHFKAQQKKYLHGEIVSAGIALQMRVNGFPESDIKQARAFLRALGTPVSFSDLEIDSTESNFKILYDYIKSAMSLSEDWMLERLKIGLREIAAGV